MVTLTIKVILMLTECISTTPDPLNEVSEV